MATDKAVGLWRVVVGQLIHLPEPHTVTTSPRQLNKSSQPGSQDTTSRIEEQKAVCHVHARFHEDEAYMHMPIKQIEKALASTYNEV